MGGPVFVAFEGKPCSGKSTCRKALNTILAENGIRNIDLKKEADRSHVHAMLVKSYENLDDNDWIGLGLTMMKRGAAGYSYITAYRRLREKGYGGVVTMDGTPYEISNFVDSFAKGQSMIPRFSYVAARAVEFLMKPDLTIYLNAPKEVLEKRFQERMDEKRGGRDKLHRYLMGHDDFEHLQFLLRTHGESRVMVEDTSKKSAERIAEEAFGRIYKLLSR